MLKYAIQNEFPATNNTAEYEGLVTRLRLAKELSIRRLLIRGDSPLMAKQVQKEYDCNNNKMAKYLAEAQRMEKFFMASRYDMSHAWTTGMWIILHGLPPPECQFHQMSLLKN
jgi:ribonuclease HI